jgi:hypothetical protein
MAALTSLILFFGHGARSVSAAPQPAQAFLSGGYRNKGAGVFRRIIVSNGRTVTYDVWRVTPNGNLEHLHFDLISPSQTPVESNDYSVRSGNKSCGRVGLRLYRDNDGGIVPFILFLSYNGIAQPLKWSGHALTDTELDRDHIDIANLAKSAHSPTFYGSLDKSDRNQLLEDVPSCH